MSDAAYGVRSSGVNGRYSTALPANVAAAASWDPNAAYEYGKLIGTELRAQGYNMSLGGGVDITREPRNGRTFEYLGRGPHPGRHARLPSSFRELNPPTSSATSSTTPSTIRRADATPSTSPSATAPRASPTCWPSRSAFSKATRPRSCAPTTASTATSPARTTTCSIRCSRRTGTSPDSFSPTGAEPTPLKKPPRQAWTTKQPGRFFFGDKYKAAVEAGRIPQAELDDHVHRILRSMFAAGVIDHPPPAQCHRSLRGI